MSPDGDMDSNMRMPCWVEKRQTQEVVELDSLWNGHRLVGSSFDQVEESWEFEKRIAMGNSLIGSSTMATKYCSLEDTRAAMGVTCSILNHPF